MKIKNNRNYGVFYPYAGMTPERGRDLGAGECSVDIEPARIFTKLLRRDLGLGYVSLVLSDLDKAAFIAMGQNIDALIKPVEAVVVPVAPKVEIKGPTVVEKPKASLLDGGALVSTPIGDTHADLPPTPDEPRSMLNEAAPVTLAEVQKRNQAAQFNHPNLGKRK